MSDTDLSPASLREAFEALSRPESSRIAAEVDGVRSVWRPAPSCRCHWTRRWCRSACRTHRRPGPSSRICRSLGIGVLGESHDAAAGTLAAKTGDRFAGLETQSRDSGAVFVHGTSVWLESTITQRGLAGRSHHRGAGGQ